MANKFGAWSNGALPTNPVAASGGDPTATANYTSDTSTTSGKYGLTYGATTGGAGNMPFSDNGMFQAATSSGGSNAGSSATGGGSFSASSFPTSTGPTQYLADGGGVLPEDGDGSDSEGSGDTDTASSPTGDSSPDTSSAMDTVLSALDYGRSQMGLGGSSDSSGGSDSQSSPSDSYGGMRQSTNVEDDRNASSLNTDGATGKTNSMGLPTGNLSNTYPYNNQLRAQTGLRTSNTVGSFDDGGAVDAAPDDGSAQPQQQQQGVLPDGNQPQQPQGGTPQGRMMGYVMGAGAVDQDQAAALEQQVDPQGQMDPNTRRLMAIANAPDKSTQFGLIQLYRQKFNAYNSFAQAAAQGTPARPANLASSTQAATAAYQHVPDGTSVSFQPTQGGVLARVTKIADRGQSKGKSKGKTASFDDGGSVPDQAIPDQSPPVQDSAPAAQPQQSPSYQDQGVIPEQPTAPISSDTAFGQDTPGIGYSPSDNSANVRAGQVLMSVPQYVNFLKGPGQFDNVMDNGADKVLEQQGQGGMNFETAGAQSQQPPEQQAPQNTTQRYQPRYWASNQPGQASPLKNELMRESDQAMDMQAAQRSRGQKPNMTVDTSGMTDAKRYGGGDQGSSTDPNAQAKIDAANQRNALTNKTKLEVEKIKALAQSGNSTAQSVTRMIDNMIQNNPHMTPADAWNSIKQANLPQLQQQQQPQQQDQGQQGQQQQAPPVSMLKAGTNTKFRNGQVWTLRGGQAVRVQ